MNIKYLQPALSDGNTLAELRVAAMRDSLLAAGRFDPARARNRFLSVYSPTDTWTINVEGTLSGFYTLNRKTDHLWLNDLYLTPQSQGAGIGSMVIKRIKQHSIAQKLPIRLGALRGSRAIDFYLKHGFVPSHEDAWDIFFECPVP